MRIQARQFRARLVCGEPPVDLGLRRVALLLPCCDLACERLGILDAPIQTLAYQHRPLDLHLVEPTPMLRRVMPLDPFENPSRFCRGNA